MMAGLLCSILLCAPGFAITQDSHASSLSIPPTKALVRARAENVVRDKHRATAEFVIEEVFLGKPELQGQRFHVVSNLKGINFNGSEILPPATKGEVGVWELVVKDKDDALIARSVREGYHSWPARKGVHPRYRQALELARTMRDVSQLDAADQRRRWRQLAESPTSEIAAWSILALAKDASPEARKQLEQLPLRVLCPVGRLALDEVRCRTLGDDEWRTGEARLRMLERLTELTDDPAALTLALTRIDQAAQRAEIDDPTTLRVIRSILDNEAVAADQRVRCLHIIGRLASRPGAGADAFRALVDQVLSGATSQLRLTASVVLRNSVPLDADRKAAVRDLLEDVKDERVRGILGQSLDKKQETGKKGGLR